MVRLTTSSCSFCKITAIFSPTLWINYVHPTGFTSQAFTMAWNACSTALHVYCNRCTRSWLSDHNWACSMHSDRNNSLTKNNYYLYRIDDIRIRMMAPVRTDGISILWSAKKWTARDDVGSVGVGELGLVQTTSYKCSKTIFRKERKS